MKNRKPDYLMAKTRIVSLIQRSNYSVGDRLPPLNELTSIIGTGRMPLQKALGLLAEEGVLRNVRGSGCYIESIPELQIKSDSRFNDFLLGPGTGKSKKSIRILMPHLELEDFPGMWENIFTDIANLRQDLTIEIERIASVEDLLKQANITTVDIIMLPSALLPYFVERKSLFGLEEFGDSAIKTADFSKGIINSAFYHDKLWGIPTICSANCLYYNKAYQEIVDAILPVSGFWDFMEKLNQLPATVCSGKLEALVANNHVLFDLFYAIFGKNIEYYEDIKDFSTTECSMFIKRFESYYQNKTIFHPEVSVDSLDTINYFSSGKTVFALGNTCWIPQLALASSVDWSILPEPLETSGTIKLNSLLFCVSNYTQYPQECLEILNNLSAANYQKQMAQNGRFVAHKKANQFLKDDKLNNETRKSIIAAVSNGRVLRTNDMYLGEYNDKLLAHEMDDWQKCAYSGDNFISQLNRKTKFFYRSKKMKEALNNNLTEEKNRCPNSLSA